DAAFMSEGAGPDIGEVIAKRQVRQLRNKAAGAGEVGKVLAADGFVAELHLQVADDGSKIGIAATFPVAVEAALDVSNSFADGSERIGDGEIGIVMGVDAEHAVETFTNFGHDFGHAIRHGAAIGI